MGIEDVKHRKKEPVFVIKKMLFFQSSNEPLGGLEGQGSIPLTTTGFFNCTTASDRINTTSTTTTQGWRINSSTKTTTGSTQRPRVALVSLTGTGFTQRLLAALVSLTVTGFTQRQRPLAA